ncbi:MAG: alpha/beta hydrolase [Anaerolineae bacterium]|nr:alpha/beta hydrolase [Anaerolineae bacterium]
MTNITHRNIQTNGISMHIAEAGHGHPVILIHGFPELWYTWRHQLPALAQAGYHAVAPDLRGYGATERPDATQSYSTLTMAADIVGLLDALGAEKGVVVGHDIGAHVAWLVAELYPQRVSAVVALSVAWQPRPPLPPSQLVKRMAQGKFSMFQYFLQPGLAEAELEADVRRSLRLFLYSLSGDAPPELVSYLFTGKPAELKLLDDMHDFDSLPPWLTEADLDYYASTYQRTGFSGALNFYRNKDRDWTELGQKAIAPILQPTLFIGGTDDCSVKFSNLAPMTETLPNLREVVLLPGCGHWVQEERSEAVSTALIEFLQQELTEK